MAIDKAIDSAQLNTDLTSIADAIREKAGLTDSFVFPEGFVEAIAGIEVGGGAKIATGTVTTNSGINGRYVLGQVDFKPAFAAIVRSEEPSAKNVLIGSISDNATPFRFTCSYNTASTSYLKMGAKGLYSVSTGYLLYTSSTYKLEYYSSTSGPCMDGTYTWVAIG